MHTDRREDPLTKRRRNRHGYALMLVIVFVVLFTAILGVSWRRVASALRVEHVSQVRRQCDAGSLQVLAKAMALLETCLQQDTTGVAKLPTSSPLNEFYETLGTSPDLTYYIVTFVPTDGDTTGRRWTVSVKTAASAEEIGSRAHLSSLLDNPNS
jgi:hypothetical protein